MTKNGEERMKRDRKRGKHVGKRKGKGRLKNEETKKMIKGKNKSKVNIRSYKNGEKRNERDR